MAITVQDAYKKVKPISGNYVLTGCQDFGEFWGFVFSTAPDEIVLGGYKTVYKNDGHISGFNPATNLDLFDKRKPVPLETFEGL